MSKIKFIKQNDAMDCGPTCLKMVTAFYGKNYSIEYLRNICLTAKDGVSLLSISKSAEKLGFRTMGGRFTFSKLESQAPLPCIIHWQQQHFVVLSKIKKKKKGTLVFVIDPAVGLVKYTQEQFLDNWLSTRTQNEEKGIALLLEPTSSFYSQGFH